MERDRYYDPAERRAAKEERGNWNWLRHPSPNAVNWEEGEEEEAEVEMVKEVVERQSFRRWVKRVS